TPSDEVRDLKISPDESSSVGQAMRRLFTLLDRREKRRFYWLLPAVTGMALLQVIGIASVLPFLALVTDPTIVETNALLSRAYELLGFQSTNGFLVFAGAAALALLVISNAFTALTEYLLLRYSWNLNHSLSVRLLREYVAKPYVFFLDQNSAALATNILSETKQAVRGFVLAALNLMSRTIVALFILALLIGLYPLLAILTFGFLGAAYAVTFMLVKRGMAESGRQRSYSDRARHQAAFEVLGGIKDIKLLGREEPFLKRYERHSRNYERQMAKQQVIALFPRYAFETIAFGGMLMIVLVLLLRGEGVQQIVPTLGVFAFATLRLLPALQSLFGSMTSLRFSVTAIDVLHRDITPDRDLHIGNRVGIEPQPFTRKLELDSIDFTYPNGKGPVLSDFSLSVAANSTVGIVGPTGSGKTTTVDILLGLLEPSAGTLKVDGVVIDKDNRAAWQSNLGYVPQQIYLADDTIAANIAFGVRAKDVDRHAVERAATLANIHDFVSNELPEGYETVIGERGVRLSGGQRQRLGIARALYHNPAVLVFDEATSALDGITEESIFKAVSELGKSKTIVMIAHRMTTVRECDVIYLLEKGAVTAKGSYDELIATNARFRAMARAGSPDDVFAEPAGVS
ncbi:MAG TPA: ABC transporter ATP-binding protein, partial [Trueperaceae bacterium]|nr:ABC transporter ATP-binding protein [Trueperaceae bacterium]